MINNIKGKETNEEMRKKAISLLRNKLERQEDNFDKEDDKNLKKRNIEEINDELKENINTFDTTNLEIDPSSENIVDEELKNTEAPEKLEKLENLEEKSLTNNKEIYHEINKEIYQEIYQDINQEINKEIPQEINKEIPQEINKEIIQENKEIELQTIPQQDTVIEQSNIQETIQDISSIEKSPMIIKEIIQPINVPNDPVSNFNESITQIDPNSMNVDKEPVDKEPKKNFKHDLLEEKKEENVVNHDFPKGDINPQEEPIQSQSAEAISSSNISQKEANSEEKKLPPSSDSLPIPVKEEAPQPKKITFMSAKKEVDEFAIFIDKVEQDIKNKYGINLSEFNYEDILPDELKLKLVEEFFNSKEILDLAKNIK